MSTTAKGDALATKLNPLMGTTLEIRETCAAICRAAVTLHRYQEFTCNGETRDWESIAPRTADGRRDWAWIDKRRERDQARIDAELERLERLIARHVGRLPQAEHPDTGERFTLGVDTGGDPRGCPVILTLPEELRAFTDDWGQTGICAPYLRGA